MQVVGCSCCCCAWVAESGFCPHFFCKEQWFLNSQPLSVLLNNREMGCYFKQWSPCHSDWLCPMHAPLKVLFCDGWPFLRCFLGTAQKTEDTMLNISIGFGCHCMHLHRFLSSFAFPNCRDVFRARCQTPGVSSCRAPLWQATAQPWFQTLWNEEAPLPPH